MIKDREPVNLGQPFNPFIEGFNKVQILLIPNGPQFPIDFRIQEVDDPVSRLDLSVQIPGMPKLTGKIRQGIYEQRELDWWFYDPSLWMARLKTPHFLPPPLPVLATPGFLGPDPNYRAGEAYGGKLVIENTPEALANIKVGFSLTDPDALPRLLAAKREIWQDIWNNFAWGRYLPEKMLIRMLDSGILDQGTADVMLGLMGGEPARTTDELLAQAEAMRVSAYRWAVRKKVESYRLLREQEDRFRM